MDYLIPIPYTYTIFFLNIVGILLINKASKSKYWKWKPFFCSLVFSFVYGLSQIYDLENASNIPAWTFPMEAVLNIYPLSNVAIEDVFFIIGCFNVFYWFLFKTRRIQDYLRRFKKENLVTVVLSVFCILEAMVYQWGGIGAQRLIIGYTVFPVLAFLLAKATIPKFMDQEINITHALLVLCFVVLFSSVWEFLNAWRQHWIYEDGCDLLSKEGWFLNKKLHIAIFFQYPWSGFLVMYFSWMFFTCPPQNKNK
jgi:hypothetical protein